MILEPSKTAEEIDRRLSALTDPEFAEVLQTLSREFAGEVDADSYVSPSAPYWKRRIGLLALAGLLALSVGYGYTGATRSSHANVRPKAASALPVPSRRHRTVATHRNKSKHTVAALTHAPPVTKPALAPVIVAPAPNEALIRQARAQLLHERAIAEQERARAALAAHQAQVAIQERAAAQHHALEEALAQARAEALAQARSEALRVQAENAASERAQEWAVQNASGSGTKPGNPMPPGTGHMSTYPNPNGPPPGPGPMDPNCTPHRGSLFQTALTSGVLNHVRLGGTSVGNLLQLVHP